MLRGYQPNQFVSLHRKKGKNKKPIESGGYVFINGDVLCKALKNAGIECTEQNLKCTVHACKDGKRAKVIVHIMKKPTQ